MLATSCGRQGLKDKCYGYKKTGLARVTHLTTKVRQESFPALWDRQSCWRVLHRHGCAKGFQICSQVFMSYIVPNLVRTFAGFGSFVSFNLKLTSYTLEFFYSKVTNFTFQLRGSHHHDGECILRLVVLVDLVRQHPTPGYVSKNTYRWTAISRLYHSNWVQYD